MTVQTAFRFPTDLVERLKLRARREHKSMNQYVEEVLVESLRPPSAGSIDALVEDIKLSSGIPQSILNMSRICLPDDAELDDRCIYILGK